VIRAQVHQGQRLILALDGLAAGLGWVDLDALEPRWQPLPSPPGKSHAWPIQALLAGGTEFLAIAGDRISVYGWGERNAAPEPVRTVPLPLEGYQIQATARTARHVAILASRISRRVVNIRGLGLWHDLGRSAPTHRRTELLLLLEAGSFRELGAPALEQRYDAVQQAPPPPRWTGLRLSETELQFQDGIAGPILIRLGDGPVEDLQQQIRYCAQVNSASGICPATCFEKPGPSEGGSHFGTSNTGNPQDMAMTFSLRMPSVRGVPQSTSASQRATSLSQARKARARTSRPRVPDSSR